MSDLIKSPTSGIPTVSEPMLMPYMRRVWDVVCVCRSVCFCNWSGEGVGVHADPSENMSRMLPGNFQDTRWYVLTTLCGGSRWVG